MIKRRKIKIGSAAIGVALLYILMLVLTPDHLGEDSWFAFGCVVVAECMLLAALLSERNHHAHNHWSWSRLLSHRSLGRHRCPQIYAVDTKKSTKSTPTKRKISRATANSDHRQCKRKSLRGQFHIGDIMRFL